MSQQTGLKARRSPLFQTERQRKIIALVETHGAIEVSELATHFHVTTETVRRDLSELQKQKLVKRVHGGAISWDSFEPLLANRETENVGEKHRIAVRAVEELPDQGSILIDAGSTLLRFAEAIPPGRLLHVCTNSLPTATAIASAGVAPVKMIGGEIRTDTLSVVDAHAVEMVHKLHFDVLFISTDGASDKGLSTPYTHEATLKEAMIDSATRVVALIDPSKFGTNHLVRFSEWGQIDVLITCEGVDENVLADIRDEGVEIVLV